MYDSYGDGWNANTLTIRTPLTVHQRQRRCSTTNVFADAGNEYSPVGIDTVCTVVTYNADGAYSSENLGRSSTSTETKW